MHDAALQYFTDYANAHPGTPHIIEIGARDVNGTIRHLFPDALTYVGLDTHDGPGVDWVGDAADYDGARSSVDLVLCSEVLEHAPNWARLLLRAYSWLLKGGALVITCAGPNRKPHAADGSRGGPPPGEWYENLSPAELRGRLTLCGFAEVQVRLVRDGMDVQAVAWK